MRDMVADFGLQKGQVLSKAQVIAWFEKKYPKIKRGTISAHLIRFSTNAQTRVYYNAKPGEDDLFFQIDGSHFRFYDPLTDPSPISITQKKDHTDKFAPVELIEQDEEIADEAEPKEFAYESDLKNFLAKHLTIIEPGLHLYEEEGITGIEFPVSGRFIDILALDSKNNYVVIELKVSRGYDRVVGQLLRYMGWIRQNQAEPSQQVRGVIVAREITEDLKLACSGIPDAQLFDYQLEVTLKKVN